MVLQAIRYTRGSLEILDQRKLPHQEYYVRINNPRDGWHAIQSMQVRGAPAIAIVAALSLAVSLETGNEHGGTLSNATSSQYARFISQSLKYLVTSRPTAVNLADAARKLERLVFEAQSKEGSKSSEVRHAYIKAAEQMLSDDVQDNENIGRYGAEWILKQSSDPSANKKLSILTHCNTGSLATAGYGTALGVIRALHASGNLLRAYYTETRPFCQGARLTGYELIHDGIPATLITDSMAASLLRLKKESDRITCIVVGADRIAANGDTANKIGTYALAIHARYHGLKFLVAAPRTTIDVKTPTGAEIRIEERNPTEVTSFKGPSISVSEDGDRKVNVSDVHEVSIAAANTHAWNPSFDVTPADLIDGIVTERGVIVKDNASRYSLDILFDHDTGTSHSKTEGKESVTNGIQDTAPTSTKPSITWEECFAMEASRVPDWSVWVVA